VSKKEEGGITTMPTLTVDCDFDVFCAECGAGLCNQTDVDDRKKKIGSLLSTLPFSSYAYLKRLSEELEKAGTK